MKRFPLLMGLAFSALILLQPAAPAAHAAEVGYIEDFALASNREDALKQLIPGTEDFYYYHCLHYQNTQQYDKVEATLEAWKARVDPNKQRNWPARLWEIMNRQALLNYDKNQQESLNYIRERIGVQFNHARENLNQKTNYPTALDANLISRDRLTKIALERHGNSLNGFEDTAIDWLTRSNLVDGLRRNMLQRLQRPDYPNLTSLVIADLRDRYTGGFGSINIHKQMLLAQLDELAKEMPELLNNTNYINTYITKLHPNDDLDWRNDPKEYVAYLNRLEAFVARLGPAYNSLKAHVLYHRLVFDRAQGNYDRQRFMAYLSLPKYVSYINNKYMELEERRKYPSDLNANFQPVTMLPVVGNDEPLIRSYLHHYFLKDENTKTYETYINDSYLTHNFAEVKLVNGLGDPERWYSMLSPSQVQQLKDRIDLDFTYTNKELFLTEEPVSIDLLVKNVKTLIVKVYEINAANFYRDNLREVDTDINLDGLVANESTTITYNDTPILRVQRHFEFAQLSRPGVYVIDFIGNGKSSRVLVRKGKLRYVARTSIAGHLFTVLNEKNEHLVNASLWLAGHEYTADKDGIIAVPFSNRPGSTPIILKNGEFTSLEHFNQESEQYVLEAGIHVDREQLIKRKKANVLIRPQLLLNGTPVGLKLLEDVTLIINSIDLDGVASTKEISDFKLSEDRDAVYEFTVPDRLAQLQFQLKAKVQNLSKGSKVDLAAGEQFAINGIDRTDRVEDLHFARMASGYVIDLLGKTGESKANRPLQLIIKHRDFRDAVNVTTQTDAAGRVLLGSLNDIAWVQATGPEGTSRQWPILTDGHSYHSTIHAKVGQPIQVPFMAGGKLDPTLVSLLELRGDTFIADRLKSAAVVNGFIKIDDLPRGDYDLFLKDSSTRILIRLTEGVQRDGFVLSDYRNLEVSNTSPLQIEAVTAGGDEIQIKLQNAGPFARVHLFATRINPAFSAAANLGEITTPEPYLMKQGRTKSAYVAGRNIGDEYRYILERKYMHIYPGNMLARPGILLNPWAIRATETGEQVAQGGDDFFGRGGNRASETGRTKGQDTQGTTNSDFSNLDFLGETSAVLLNLSADKDGLITLKRADLGDHQQLTIVAIDPHNTAYRYLALPEAKNEFVDLRLKNGLDPAKHFTEQKQISIVGKDGKFILSDISTSKFEAYDTLARVYSLYATLSNDPQLIEFGFILSWPKLKQEEKQTLYSKYACHELNIFILKKDPAFFAQVVQPYLANKRDKTFVDQWLLDNASASYLEPWEYGRLNIVERILLSQKLKGEKALTARHVKDLYDLIPPDLERFNYLYQTALKGSSLDTGEGLALALEEQLDKVAPAEKLKSELRRLQETPLGTAAGEGSARPGASLKGPAGKFDAPPAPSAPMEDAAAASKPRDQRESKEDGKKSADRDYAGENMKRADESRKEVEFADQAKDSLRRQQVRQYYRKLDKTQEWVENNYYKLPIEVQNASLVTVNGFWNDYAKHNPAQPFYSVNLAEASLSFTDMMLALAVLDLPFEAGKHESQYDQLKMTLSPGSPMVIFHKEIKESASVAKQTPILVSQNFFRASDRYRHENNERMDKYVTDEFLVGVVYGCQVVITNPTSSNQKLDVLLQVPVGAMAVAGGQQTKGVHIQLGAFSTQAIEYSFYFPAAGEYAHYPVHVAKNEQAIAFASPFKFKVVNELSKLDKESWDYVSQFGTEDEVFAYLQVNNLHRTDLDRIAFRMKDKAFFQKVIVLLAQRHAYNHTLFSYGLLHNEPGVAREFLEHSDGFVSQCGQWLESTLLTINPIERRSFEFMEYSPLVNARAHQLGKRRQIVNERVAWQYHRQLHVLTYKRTLSADDLLAITYYLLLQDRVEDAMETFAQVDSKKVTTAMQYDLVASYLDFYSADLKIARGIVEKYKDHPVDRWRTTFAAISKQLDQVQGKVVDVADKDDRDQTQAMLAATAPNFDFNVEAKKINLTYQNLQQVKINYYLMDVELLFSRNPFVQQFSGEFSYIKPNDTAVVNLNDKATVHSLPLPAKYHTSNVLVEIVGAGQTLSRAYYSNAMSVQTIENYGQVRVTQATTAKALPRTYVKVYAQLANGQVKFYKDGYTDLRGRFDYSSLNTDELASVQKFSILVLSEEHGAIVREATPPKQ